MSKQQVLQISVPMLIFMCIAALVSIGSAQRTARSISFDELGDFVNDWNKRKDGERFVVTGVPVSHSITYEKGYRMYLFQPSEDSSVANSFYTSLALTKAFRPHLDSAATSLRVACSLIQFAGEFDVYRSPYATRVEGLDDEGNVIWTASAPQPVKFKFRQ